MIRWGSAQPVGDGRGVKDGVAEPGVLVVGAALVVVGDDGVSEAVGV